MVKEDPVKKDYSLANCRQFKAGGHQMFISTTNIIQQPPLMEASKVDQSRR
jgi:hypothetical protein